ncbi:serine hydrolase [Lewinella sp. W8]|uniref:serine hydrolase domain-containing protein n=1 Tax=Lewinella sp. W8 TaxID=2528208 RepID=UPI001067D927|nr:serine hydrolase domain-containing protein [Lewinella sp. W8]MTB52214.1 serine hydrolase [Lewinella sp. W8]
MMKGYLLVFLMTFFLAPVLLAQDSDREELISAINERIDELWESSRAPGLSFSVAFPDGEVKTFTRGFANVEKGERMSAKSKMLGGSTGKVFYSVVALQLIEEGKLQLDVPIIKWMSDLDWFTRIPNAEELTVRALMRHESGIPRYVFKEDFQRDVIRDVDKVWKPKELLSYVFDDAPLFAVGEDFSYSDTNYIILCALIEKLTGNSIYAEVQKRVLDRAGLKDVIPQTGRSFDNIALGYHSPSDPFYPGVQFDETGKSNYNLQFEWAGGGLVITTRDLALLGKKIYEGQMFAGDLLDEYFNGREAAQLGGQWGLGVHIRQSPLGTVYGHSGFMPGYITNLLYYPEHKFSICYQINTSDRERTSILRELPSVGKVIVDQLDE